MIYLMEKPQSEWFKISTQLYTEIAETWTYFGQICVPDGFLGNVVYKYVEYDVINPYIYH